MTGIFYDSIKAVKHPNFISEEESYDVGLVKLANHIPVNKTEDYYLVNIICLPTKTMIFERNEPVLISGWGYEGDRLRIGEMLLDRYKQSAPSVLVTLKGTDGTYACKVSSELKFHIQEVAC